MSDIMEGEEWLEAMTPRQMRQLIRTLQADLGKAVQDRATTVAALKQVYDLAWNGMEQVPGRPGYATFSDIADVVAIAQTKLEGKG